MYRAYTLESTATETIAIIITIDKSNWKKSHGSGLSSN